MQIELRKKFKLIFGYMLSILLVTSCDTPELNKKPVDFSWEIKMIISENHRKGGISNEIYSLAFDAQEKKAQLQLERCQLNVAIVLKCFSSIIAINDVHI